MSAKAEFSHLLSEARLVVDLALHSGRATPALLRSLRAAEQEFETTGAIEQNLDTLMGEMRTAEAALRPGELVVRKSAAYLREFIPRTLFYIAAFLVIISTFVYTTRYISMKNNLAHLELLQSQNILDVAFRFWMMSPQMKTPDALLHDPPSATEKNLILEKLEQVAQLNDQIEVYRGDADNNLLQYNQDIFLSLIPSRIDEFLTGFDPSQFSTKSAYPQLTAGSGGVAADRSNGPAIGNIVKKLGDSGRHAARAAVVAAIPGPTSGGPVAAPPSGSAGALASLSGSGDSSTESDYFENLHFHGIAQLLAANPNAPTVQPIESILNQEKQLAERYGQVVLPVVLGMLGAIVYHIRLMLNNPAALPSYWRINLRILLGGLAGVSGAIFISAVGREQSGPLSTGVWGFLLAFLLGFSLELFFVVLDRFVQFAEDRLKPGGDPHPAAPALTGASGPVASL